MFGLAKLKIDFDLTDFTTKSEFKLKCLIFENGHVTKVKQQI